MLRWLGDSGTRFCDGQTRRELLQAGGLGLGGLTLPRLLRASEGSSQISAIAPRAKSVIMLFLSGGPAQQDMWDLKPEAPAEVRGTFQPINTNVPGMQICEHL